MNISDVKKWLPKYRGSTKPSERIKHELPEGFIPGKVTNEGMSAVSESIRKRMLHEERKQWFQRLNREVDRLSVSLYFWLSKSDNL